MGERRRVLELKPWTERLTKKGLERRTSIVLRHERHRHPSDCYGSLLIGHRGTDPRRGGPIGAWYGGRPSHSHGPSHRIRFRYSHKVDCEDDDRHDGRQSSAPVLTGSGGRQEAPP